jgi:hypothetical protein
VVIIVSSKSDPVRSTEPRYDGKTYTNLALSPAPEKTGPSNQSECQVRMYGGKKMNKGVTRGDGEITVIHQKLLRKN